MATLIVEDGSGVTDANSYCSVVVADVYHTERDGTTRWQEATEVEKARALIWATRLLDDLVWWRGQPVLSREAPRWPRAGMRDVEGRTIASSTMPRALQHAVAEFARQLIEDPQRVNRAEDAVNSASAGGRSRNYPAGRQPTVIPRMVRNMIAALAVPENVARIERAA